MAKPYAGGASLQTVLALAQFLGDLCPDPALEVPAVAGEELMGVIS